MMSTREITAAHAAELRSSAAPLANSTDLANIQHPSRLLACSLPHARSHFHNVLGELRGRKEGVQAQAVSPHTRAQLTFTYCVCVPRSQYSVQRRRVPCSALILCSGRRHRVTPVNRGDVLTLYEEAECPG